MSRSLNLLLNIATKYSTYCLKILEAESVTLMHISEALFQNFESCPYLIFLGCFELQEQNNMHHI